MMDWDSGVGGSEKWLNSEYVLDIELTRFACGLYVEYE